ncbi:MAG: hypothetical protein KIS66_02075 [Fimbriimonadaceae bacterium]|nr:hypothetical protein [Fimbriimonadaceae bacterium]
MQRSRRARFVLPILALLVLTGPSLSQVAPPAGGTPVFPINAHLTTPVSGLERTKATGNVFVVKGPGFQRALHVAIGTTSPDTNVTQLTVLNTVAVSKGDALLATLFIRGRTATGKPARAEFLFERSTDPWTKSATLPIEAYPDPLRWRQVWVAFRSVETYSPGEVMTSVRLAFGPQTVELGGLTVLNYGKSRSLDDLQGFTMNASPLGKATVVLNPRKTKQTMRGFGGNFCQPRYGANEPFDPVGRYTLSNLKVVHARVGVPLERWAPEPGVYKDDGPARASLLQLQEFARRKIPTVASVWEGPEWMLPGRREQNGKVLPLNRYEDCIEAIAQYLVTARDKYGAPVEYFSFNEPDYGVNFRFTPAAMRAFIAKAGPRFESLGLKTKFLVSDTANGSNLYDHARPLLEDKAIARYLGPISFHCWDALGASEEAYRRIAELARKHGKEVWCLEAGHDAALWQAENPWSGWENALRTALAYARTLRLTEASLMDYWTYQDNYPLVTKDGATPYPVFEVMRQMEAVFVPGSRVIEAIATESDVQALATMGPLKGRTAVLLVNPVGTGTVTVTGLPKSAIVAITTSRSGKIGDLRKAKSDAKGSLSLEVPARSVVTVVAGDHKAAARVP